ncbi:MAG: aspartate carbamoyltransferase [Eubacteriales bacterium]|nr:aspartate carbamoyltransferase [Eubacteriales bacterium]
MKSLLDILDLDRKELQQLIDTASDIRKFPGKYSHACDGKILATLFYEPSTRTRMSFESAMLSLGGGVISMADAESSSSAKKGETVIDTARVISCYADIIAIRHSKEGAALAAADKGTVPVINAGDGGHGHPTQTLADLMTICTEKGRMEDLTIGVAGDLKYGRTVHSLISAFSLYSGIKLVLISPEELSLPRYVIDSVVTPNHMEYIESRSLEEHIGDLDVIYMTRIQQERFEDPTAYGRLKDSFILNGALMASAKDDCIVMHPLPRVNEIAPEVDEDKRACYFKQVANGRSMRMALIKMLLEEAQKDPIGKEIGLASRAARLPEPEAKKHRCKNERCITYSEPSTEPIFVTEDGRHYRCAYCERTLALK